MPGRVTTTLVTATHRHCDQDTRDPLTRTHLVLVTVKALDLVMVRDLDLVMAKALDFTSLVPIAGRAAMTGNIYKRI